MREKTFQIGAMTLKEEWSKCHCFKSCRCSIRHEADHIIKLMLTEDCEENLAYKTEDEGWVFEPDWENMLSDEVKNLITGLKTEEYKGPYLRKEVKLRSRWNRDLLFYASESYVLGWDPEGPSWELNPIWGFLPDITEEWVKTQTSV